MADPLRRRALRGAFYLGGAVAAAAGSHTALAGGASLPGRSRLADAGVESELRFYAAFYVAYGVALLRVAPRADSDPAAVRAAASALALGGIARALGWRAAGRPAPLQAALLALELGLPPLVVGWRAWAARGTAGG